MQFYFSSPSPRPTHRALAALALVLVSSAGLAQTTTDATELRGWLRAPQAAAQMRQCVAALSPEQVQRYQNNYADGNLSTTLVDRQAQRYLVIGKDQWACIGLSEQGFARIPLGALQEVFRIGDGKSPDALAAMNRIRTELAETGYAKVLIKINSTPYMVNPAHNAYFFSLESGPVTSFSLRSSPMLLKDYNPPDWPHTLEPTAHSTRMHALDTPLPAAGQPNLAQQQRAGRVNLYQAMPDQRPLLGDHLMPTEDATTGAFNFANTQWRSYTSPKTQWIFEPGGVLVERTASGTTTGQWRVERGGVLASLGARFLTMELGQASQSNTLRVASRIAARSMPGMSLETAQRMAGAASASQALIDALTRPTQLSESRTELRMFNASDAKALEAATAAWREGSERVNALIEAQRTTRLRELPVLDAESGSWSLCNTLNAQAFSILQEFDNADLKEVCRAYTGPRSIWRDILQNGCSGRCQAGALPLSAPRSTR